MSTILIPSPEAQLPAAEEVRAVRDGSRRLAAMIESSESANVTISGAGAETIEIPAPAARLLVEILTQMGQGNAVQVVPVRAEITTQQAADFLNVSQSYVTDRLAAGELSFRDVGKHRLLRFEEVWQFKKRTECESNRAMAELAALSQGLGLY